MELVVGWSLMGKNCYLFCFLRPAVLKSMVPHQRHGLSVTWEFLGSTPDLLSQKLWGWYPVMASSRFSSR